MIKKNELMSFIIDWLVINTDNKREDISEMHNIFEIGYLDSLSMFRLLFDVENHFSIAINQSLFFKQSFTTLTELALAIIQCASECSDHDL